MKDSNPLDTLIELVAGTPTYKETSSWCLPAEFTVSKLLTKKLTEFSADKVLAPKPLAEFKPHVWKQIGDPGRI